MAFPVRHFEHIKTTRLCSSNSTGGSTARQSFRSVKTLVRKMRVPSAENFDSSLVMWNLLWEMAEDDARVLQSLFMVVTCPSSLDEHCVADSGMSREMCGTSRCQALLHELIHEHCGADPWHLSRHSAEHRGVRLCFTSASTSFVEQTVAFLATRAEHRGVRQALLHERIHEQCGADSGVSRDTCRTSRCQAGSASRAHPRALWSRQWHVSRCVQNIAASGSAFRAHPRAFWSRQWHFSRHFTSASTSAVEKMVAFSMPQVGEKIADVFQALIQERASPEVPSSEAAKA